MGYNLYAGIAAMVVVLIIVVGYTQTKWFWLTDLSYRLPLVGKLDRYASKVSKAEDGSLDAANKLCEDYALHCECLSKERFDKNMTYLRKCSDNGRKPKSFAVKVTMFVLIVAESAGFASLLSSVMALEGSENMLLLLTFAILIVLAVILFKIMEAAGQQLYKTRLIRQNFVDFRSYGANHSDDNSRIKIFQTEKVSLSDPQDVDDHCPPPVQFANRVLSAGSDRGSYLLVIFAIASIFAIAGLTTFMRIDTAQASAAAASGSFFGNGDDLASTAANVSVALSSFWLLAVIFVATQFLGIVEGYQFGFCGKESSSAFAENEGAADYDSYFAKYKHRIQVAGTRLSSLYLKINEENAEQDHDMKFIEFLRDHRSTSEKMMLDTGMLSKSV